MVKKEKGKIFLLCVVVCTTVVSLYAQEKESAPVIREGLLRAQLTISPSIIANAMYHTTAQGFANLHGTLEYFCSRKLSIRGDGYFSLVTRKKRILIFPNHSLFAGASFHLSSRKKSDWFIAFEPGLGYSVTRGTDYCVYSPEASWIPCEPVKTAALSPLASFAFGYCYYAEKIFNFCSEIRIVRGEHMSHANGRINLSGVYFSFGLGFDFHTKK